MVKAGVNKVLFIIGFVLIFLPGFSQTRFFGFEWAKSFTGAGNDGATGTATDSAGNVFVVGSFVDTLDADPDTANAFSLISSGSADCYLIKLNAAGQLQWAYSFGGVGQDLVNSIHVDGWGNILMTGSFIDTVDFDPGNGVFKLGAPATKSDMFVLKLNNSGHFLWAKAFGNPNYESESCTDITTDSVGNIYSVGYFSYAIDFDPGAGNTTLVPSGTTDAFVQKFDSNGTFLMAAKAGTDKRAQAVVVDKAGYIIYAGSGTGGPNGYQIRVCMLRPNGTTLWSKETGASSYDIALDLCLDADGNIYATGRFNGSVSFGTGWNLNSYDSPFLWKLSNAGNTIWAKEVTGPWNSSKPSFASSVCLYNKYVFLAGLCYTINSQNGLVAKYDTSGAKLFSTIFESVQYNNFNQGIATDTSGNVYVANTFNRTIDFCPGNGVFNLTAGGSLGLNDPALIRFHPCTPSTDTLYITACDRYITPQGMIRTSSGTYNETISNVSGCDSFLVIYLTINQSFLFTVQNKTVCDSFVAPSGKIVKSSGMYYDTLQRVNGCDSIYQFNLTVNQSRSSAPVIHSCGPYQAGSNVFPLTGMYVLYFTAANGCDSVVNLNLTVTNLNLSVIQNSNTFTSLDSAAFYQWLRCDAGYAPVPGATTASFTPLVSGSYAVHLSLNGCHDTSLCYPFQAAGLSGPWQKETITVYPNPSSGEININLGRVDYSYASAETFDLSGKSLYIQQLTAQNNNLSMPLPAGFYLLRIKVDGYVYHIRLIMQ